MKLHLGCGQVILDGYQNIDFPQSHHSVQKIHADDYADITKLIYKRNTVDEIRLHHVFEHFPRYQAIALLVAWRQWLKVDGIVRIEVPDFYLTALNALNPVLNFNVRSSAMRHIFGSNEAPWAVHYEGWTEERLRKVLETTGFKIHSIKRNSWKGTHNIDIVGKETSEVITLNKVKDRVKTYLSNYLIDSSASEINLLKVWMKEYDYQVRKSGLKS